MEHTNQTHTAAEAAQEIINTMIQLAKSEGDKIRAKYGREPTEREAEEIASMIMRQARTANAILGRN